MPLAVSRYAPIAPHLSTDNSHPEGWSLGTSARVGWVKEQEERGAGMNKTIPQSVLFVFFVSFSPGSGLGFSFCRFFFNSQGKTGFERFQLSPRCLKPKCSSNSLHANEQKANMTAISCVPMVCPGCAYVCTGASLAHLKPSMAGSTPQPPPAPAPHKPHGRFA